MTNLAEIGHNNPPEPTPFEESLLEITDLYDEAKNWCDGEGVRTQADADGVSQLINMLRQAKQKADYNRKEEAKPHDEAKAEIQTRYAPLIAETKAVTGKVVLAIDVCKKALAPFLAKQEAEKRAVAEAARVEAEEKQRLAQEALRATRPDNLEEREAAEVLAKDAQRAEATAKRMEKDKVSASSSVGRAVTLRTSWSPVLTDGVVAARHYWATNRNELETFLTSLAEKDIRAGVREIPGFTVNEEQTVA